MVLCRPDAWPIHDIALAQALAEVRGLPTRPSPEQLDAAAEAWRPLARGRGEAPVAPLPVGPRGAARRPRPLTYVAATSVCRSPARSRSLRIAFAASRPGAPDTHPPGWVPEPHW